MSIHNRARPYIKLMRKYGVEVQDLSMTGSCHIKIFVNANGNSRFFIAPYSPSDRRGIKNFEADLKRWINQ